LVLSMPAEVVALPAKARAGAATQAVATVPVRVTLYDVRGRRVRTLLDAPASTGTLRLTWDGRDDGGRELGSGLYFYRVTAGHHSASGKLTLLR
jgi:flagellar hook assembly protein FlgD